METNVKRTWMPTTAGILNIIVGALSALGAMGMIIAVIAVGSINIMRFLPPEDVPFVAPVIVPILVVILVFFTARAVFTIVGGVFALQRRK